MPVKRDWRVAIWIVVLWCTLSTAQVTLAQIEEVRIAIALDDHLGALRALSGISDDSATPDTYLYRSIVYARLGEYKQALDAFRAGSIRYPTDPRFHAEGGVRYNRAQDIVAAKALLRGALLADPDDIYGSELLVELNLSDGNMGSALVELNKRGQPKIARILDNYSLTASNSTKVNALAFSPGEILNLNSWKTTIARLKATQAFTDIDLKLERTLEGETHNVLLHTSRKSNSARGFLRGVLRGLPVRTSYLDIWNIGGSFVHWTSKYRWDPARRRVEGQLFFPVQLPGLLFVELGGAWRSEDWDIPTAGRFRYKSTGGRLNVAHIPDHRVKLGAGLEYVNRPGGNTGRLLFSTRFRPMDGDFKSQLGLDTFIARASWLGDLNYSGGTLHLANRLVLSEDRATFLDLSVKGGTSWGLLPVQDYFMLGIDSETADPLRAHVASENGYYGRGPMGTGFILLNSDIERRIAVLPVLGNVPINGEFFLDVARLSDRGHIVRQRGWLADVGVAVRALLTDFDFVLIYGRNLSEGKSTVSVYTERRFW